MVLLSDTSRARSRQLKSLLRSVSTHLLMMCVVGPFVFFFFYMVWSSFKPDWLFYEPGVWLFEPTWINYADVLSETDILRNLLNSAIISGLAVTIGLTSGIMTAYALARYDMRRLAFVILMTRMIPYITALMPLWLLYKTVGLVNTHIGIALSHLVFVIPIGVWIMIGFIEDIPRELEEAAWIDGASRIQTLFKVVLPLCTPGIVATAILTAIFSWNNFQMALILGGIDTNTAPIAVYKYAYSDSGSGGMGQMMAAATMVTIPVFVVVVFIQKQMASGLVVGGISK